MDLRRQYQIQVFAIRREGHFIQFPHGDVAIQSGDLAVMWEVIPAEKTTEND